MELFHYLINCQDQTFNKSDVVNLCLSVFV